jgi:branched-chain amino acid transport system substrate-binding protein
MTSAPLRVGACLSLSGRFGQFGRQAAAGLETWQQLCGDADLLIEDDRSDPQHLETVLPSVAARCDLLLGPYSSLLMRTAGQIASEAGLLLWNHGGSGDEAAWPGHVVSVLTPTVDYSRPFIARLQQEMPLRIAQGKGTFGRQVAEGAEVHARANGITAQRLDADGVFDGAPGEDWVLLTAGTFEHDIAVVSRALQLTRKPRLICAVAAGVRAFGQEVQRPDGIFGIAQWFPGSLPDARIGPPEDEFVAAYSRRQGMPPDYPAVQAAATAALAVHCSRTADSVSRQSLWTAATALETSSMFGPFTIDPATGAQTGHETILVEWSNDSPYVPRCYSNLAWGGHHGSPGRGYGWQHGHQLSDRAVINNFRSSGLTSHFPFVLDALSLPAAMLRRTVLALQFKISAHSFTDITSPPHSSEVSRSSGTRS